MQKEEKHSGTCTRGCTDCGCKTKSNAPVEPNAEISNQQTPKVEPPNTEPTPRAETEPHPVA
jgi:predicted  nucleic acid-binding Zn-ribbon protein